MACSITFVILLQAEASMRCALQRPHAPACLTYAGTSTVSHISVVIYLTIDKKLTSQKCFTKPGRALHTARQRCLKRKASERIRLGGYMVLTRE